MEAYINTYSPNDVFLDIGNFICQSWESIQIVRATPSFKVIRGIRGKNTRVPNPDSSATIKIRVMQTSHTNDILSSVHAQDIEAGTGRMQIMLKDKSGSSVFHSDEAYITNYPVARYTGDIVYHEWEIFCQRTSKYVVGGNNTPETKLFDAFTRSLTGILN